MVGIVTPVLENGSEYGETAWAPFDDPDTQDTLIGLGLDSGFLFAYALGMFVSGHIAERVDLRYFLTIGMTLRYKSTSINQVRSVKRLFQFIARKAGETEVPTVTKKA